MSDQVSIDNTLSLLGEPFQLSMIKAVIEDPMFFHKIRDVFRVEFFSLEYIRICYKLIDDHYIQYHLVPDYAQLETLIKANLVRREFERDRILKELYKIRLQPQKNLHYVKERIVEFCRMQQFQKATKEADSLLESLQKNPTGQLEVNYDLIIDTYKSIKKIDLELLDGGLFDGLEELYRGGTHRKGIISTNSRMLDFLLGGGPAQGELHAMAAFTNTFKTTFIIDIGCAAFFQGKKVLHFTLENTKEQVKAGYHSRIIEKPRKRLKDNIPLLKEAEEKYSPGKIEIVQLGKKRHTVGTIESIYTRYLDRDFEPDMIIIDSPSHLLPPRYSEKENNNVARVWEDVESVSKEFCKPIFGTAQLNREAGRNNEQKKLSDIVTVAEAIQIAQVCASFTTINRSKEDKLKGIVKLLNSKTRESIPGIDWDMRVYGSIGKFVEFEPEINNKIAGLIAEQNTIDDDTERELKRLELKKVDKL